MPIPPLAEPARRRLRDNYQSVRERMNRAFESSSRTDSPPRLLAVTKRVPDPVVAALLGELDHKQLAENRLQARQARSPELAEVYGGRFELIGHLQTNKARRAVELFHACHSLDSERLVERLDSAASTICPSGWPVLVQVNVAREPQKFGCLPEDLEGLLESVLRARHLSFLGLMTMAPFDEDPEAARPYFRELRERSLELRRIGKLPSDARELSMGMSHDFEVAIEEGATIVRVGTALFSGVDEPSPDPTSFRG